MSAGWVAGSVRARALARRRLGREAARQIARSGSLRDALGALAATAYGRDVRPGQSVTGAQFAVACVLLWQMRVLAGWLPLAGAGMMRTLAGWFEIANADGRLDALAGGAPAPEFQLGALATAWPRLEAARSPEEMRAVLTTSPWGDPGGSDPLALRLGMRVSWATRVAALPHCGPDWAAAAAALLLAGEKFAAGREITGPAAARLGALLGAAPLQATTLSSLARALPRRLRWLLPQSAVPGDLWRAEAGLWAHAESDGFAMLASSRFSSEPVLGAVAVLATDAWRLRAALEMAARGTGPVRSYDAIAYDPETFDAAAFDVPAAEPPGNGTPASGSAAGSGAGGYPGMRQAGDREAGRTGRDANA